MNSQILDEKEDLEQQLLPKNEELKDNLGNNTQIKATKFCEICYDDHPLTEFISN